MEKDGDEKSGWISKGIAISEAGVPEYQFPPDQFVTKLGTKSLIRISNACKLEGAEKLNTFGYEQQL